MNKKAVTILSVLAIVFAGAAMGLWYTIKGKTELAMDKLTPLSEFYSAPGTFEARLTAPKKAAEEIEKLREDVKQKAEDISNKAARIAALETKLKEAIARGDDLEVKSTNLTRERDDLAGKVEATTAELNTAKTKVKDLEERAAKLAEESAKEREELQKQIDSDKKSMRDELLAARKFYTSLYNHATSKGVSPNLPSEPWEKNLKAEGPQFIKTVHVGQLVRFDARQALLVINIGSGAGIEPDQGFDLLVADKPVAKVYIAEILNNSMSTAVFAKDSPTPKLTDGTPIKLVPFGVVTEDTSAVRPALNIVIPPPAAKTAEAPKPAEGEADPAPDAAATNPFSN